MSVAVDVERLSGTVALQRAPTDKDAAVVLTDGDDASVELLSLQT